MRSLRFLPLVPVLLLANACTGSDAPPSAAADAVPSAAHLAQLPDGLEKRAFLIECTGCHAFDAKLTRPDGSPRSRASWREKTALMLSFAGDTTDFPILAPSRDADRTADWLSRNIPAEGPAGPPRLDDLPEMGDRDVREFATPRPDEVPHDIAIASDGRVLVTGMSSHQMYVLDPATGGFSPVAIPVETANPRAVEVDSAGAWWVLLGYPEQLGRYDPATKEWRLFELGMYPHEIALSGGRVWFNGHFTRSPERIGYVDTRSGEVRTFEVPVPAMPDSGSNIPYGMRAAPDGTIWMTELRGNRLIGFDPATERFSVHELPTPASGPRRLDVAVDGTVWIPQYATSSIAKFDPATAAFTEYALPIADALPYVVRVHPQTGHVWIGTGATDLMFSFDPSTARFQAVHLPTPGAMVRHLAIDSTSGAVWGASSPFPAVNPRVFRIRP